MTRFTRKLIYIGYRLVTSARHRIRRRFTRAGLAVLGGGVLTGVLSVNSAVSLSYQIFTILICLLAVAWMGSRFFRGRYSAVRQWPRLGTAGDALNCAVRVRNHTARLQTDLCLLEDLEDPRPKFPEFVALQQAEERHHRSFKLGRRRWRLNYESARIKATPIPPLAPGQEMEVRVEITPKRRGAIRFTGITIARPDPLGLMRAFLHLPLPAALLVLPKRYPLPPIALPGTIKYQQGGVALASSVGASEAFVSLREYRFGDPLRHIHWRSWAKVGQPIVKEFEDEFFVRHALILDTFADHPRSEVFEEAVSVAASFASTAQTQESLLDLLFVGPEAFCFTIGRGLAHTEQMLEILASVQVSRDRDFTALETLVLNHVNRVSGCVGVFLAWDEPRRELVGRLRKLRVPMLVLVIVEPGEVNSIDPGPMQDDPIRFHVLELGKIEEGLAGL